MKNELTIKILKMEENLVDKDHVKQILNYMDIIEKVSSSVLFWLFACYTYYNFLTKLQFNIRV